MMPPESERPCGVRLDEAMPWHSVDSGQTWCVLCQVPMHQVRCEHPAKRGGRPPRQLLTGTSIATRFEGQGSVRMRTRKLPPFPGLTELFLRAPTICSGLSRALTRF